MGNARPGPPPARGPWPQSLPPGPSHGQGVPAQPGGQGCSPPLWAGKGRTGPAGRGLPGRWGGDPGTLRGASLVTGDTSIALGGLGQGQPGGGPGGAPCCCGTSRGPIVPRADAAGGTSTNSSPGGRHGVGGAPGLAGPRAASPRPPQSSPRGSSQLPPPGEPLPPATLPWVGGGHPPAGAAQSRSVATACHSRGRLGGRAAGHR